MISCSNIKDSHQCQYYLDMTQSDYYANRYEQAGYWLGTVSYTHLTLPTIYSV